MCLRHRLRENLESEVGSRARMLWNAMLGVWFPGFRQYQPLGIFEKGSDREPAGMVSNKALTVCRHCSSAAYI